jgi:hypothetical protein
MPLWSVEECCWVILDWGRRLLLHSGEDGLYELGKLGAVVEIGGEPELRHASAGSYV